MDWKKEIKLSDLFGRKKTAEARTSEPAGAEKPVPFWKKEISLRRGPKPAAAAPAAELAELAPVADEDWVREQLAAAAAAAAAAPAEPAVPPIGPPAPAPGIHPPVPASELPPAPKAKKESLLKKEISFRRRKPPVRDSGPVEGAPGEPGGSPAGTDPKPFWKKEISLKRKPKEPKAPKAPKEPKAQRGPKPKA